jgi:hypothetical protein
LPTCALLSTPISECTTEAQNSWEGPFSLFVLIFHQMFAASPFKMVSAPNFDLSSPKFDCGRADGRNYTAREAEGGRRSLSNSHERKLAESAKASMCLLAKVTGEELVTYRCLTRAFRRALTSSKGCLMAILALFDIVSIDAGEISRTKSARRPREGGFPLVLEGHARQSFGPCI